jgi:hypothetical protein
MKFEESNKWAEEYLKGWLGKKETRANFSMNDSFELACAFSGFAITCCLVGKFAEASVCSRIFFRKLITVV